jgi:hypothetical protein
LAGAPLPQSHPAGPPCQIWVSSLRRSSCWRGEPFVDFDDDSILANILRAHACIRASRDPDVEIDLMLSGVGLAWDEVSADAVPFRIGDVEVRVGRLERLLESKRLAGRPKDVEFLRMFAARYADEDREE